MRGLCPDADAAVWALAFAENLPQRAALIAIEEELPFLWASTSVAAWKGAFTARANLLTDKFAAIGAGDRRFATDMLAKALIEIVGFERSVAGHAWCVAAQLIASDPGLIVGAGDFLNLAKRLSPACAREGMHEAIDDLVKRHADDAYWRRFELAELLGDEADAIPYDVHCRDVIAAPHVAAAIALGQLPRDAAIVATCRQARMFDPDYFDDVAPRALVVRADGQTWFTRGRAR
jgi:hypothetical protein